MKEKNNKHETSESKHMERMEKMRKADTEGYNKNLHKELGIKMQKKNGKKA